MAAGHFCARPADLAYVGACMHPHLLMAVWTEHGLLRGVMRGYWVTVVREAPAYAGFYAGFESGKTLFRNYVPAALTPSHDTKDKKHLKIWALMASGSLGGISNWLACYPIGAFFFCALPSSSFL